MLGDGNAFKYVY